MGPLPVPAGPSPDHHVGIDLGGGTVPATPTAPGSLTSNPAGAPTSAPMSSTRPMPDISYAVLGLAPPRASSGPTVGTKSPGNAPGIIGATAAARVGAPSARVRRKQRSKLSAGARGYRYEFPEATAAMDTPLEAPAHAEFAAHTASSQGDDFFGFTGTRAAGSV